MDVLLIQKSFDFAADHDHDPNPEILKGMFTTAGFGQLYEFFSGWALMNWIIIFGPPAKSL